MLSTGGPAAGQNTELVEIRRAEASDRSFIVEMARLACALNGRAVPDADDPELTALLTSAHDPTLIAVDGVARPMGAVWTRLLDPPLIRDKAGRPVPELVIAVRPDKRGHGVGTGLLDAIARVVAEQDEKLALNVHLLNPAVRLYVRAGFRVAGRGRGWYGVAMTRPLDAGRDTRWNRKSAG